ncbi:MAG: NfeD family protein [Desulfitobacteriia bacterium]
MFIGLALSLIIVGIILIFLEIFIIPGFGIAGIPGIIIMLFGVYLAADNFAEGVIYLLVTFLVTGLLIFIGLKTGHLKKIWRKISLDEKQNSNQGYIAPKEEYVHYQGKTGTALTLLRPAGSALIEGERVDVVTEGSFIAKGSKIKVIAVEGTRVIVAKDENQ